MRLRAFGAALAMCVLSSSAFAQDGLRSASLPDRTPQNPLPPPRVDQFRAGPKTYTLPVDRAGRRHRRAAGVYGAPLGYGMVSDGFVPTDYARAMAPVPNGYLHLQMQPATAQVYVDGAYMGTVDDFRRLIPGRSLEAGLHRVELRASGYETVAFDAVISPHETLTYRADLEPTRPRVDLPIAPPARPKTFYVIPGCYAGDKPPRSVILPRGCSASNTRAIPSSLNIVAPRRRR
jgi:hypothetical protein